MIVTRSAWAFLRATKIPRATISPRFSRRSTETFPVRPFTIKDNEPKNGNTLAGVYVQDEWKLFEKLTVNYGLRFDYMNAYVTADQLSPRLGLVYKLTAGHHAARRLCPILHAAADRADLAEDSVTVREHLQCGVGH